MENSKSKIIKEIAQKLDCGFDCYYNPTTDEIVTIPNFGEMMDEDEFRDAFGAELKKVKEISWNGKNHFRTLKTELTTRILDKNGSILK